MAGQQPKGGGNSVLGNWIKSNYFIKIFIFFILITFLLFVLLGALQTSNIGIKPLQNYILFLNSISEELNFLPIYSSYANRIEAYVYYYDNSYVINKSVFTEEFLNFYLKIMFETLPFFVIFLLFLPKFIHVKSDYENYFYGQLTWRNLKPIDKAQFRLESIIKSEGTFGEDKSMFADKEIDSMANLYNKRGLGDNQYVEGLLGNYKSKLKNNLFAYIDSIEKLRKKLKTQKEWDLFFKKAINENENLTEHLYLPNLSFYDFDKDMDENEKERIFDFYCWDNHFKFIQELGKSISKEMYIPSINKEVSKEELLKGYEVVLLFWMAKQTKNFSMHDYTVNLNVPLEFKIMSKWVAGRNAPASINVSTNPNVPRREARTRISEIYYRIYHFKEYLNLDTDYMIAFLDRINKKLD